MSSRILITGTEGWAIDQVGRDLRRAGHEVLECHDAEAPAFPCLGLVQGRCPLEQRIDVVLCVRARPLPEPTRHEVVVTCGLRDRVPLVVAGATVLNPFADFCADVVEGLDADDIQEALARAIAFPHTRSVPIRLSTTA